MDALLFLAADYANHETSGKLNVLGIFNLIMAKEFPAKHRRLYLVIRMAARLGEYETKQDMRIVFYNEAGHEIAAQQGEVLIPRPPESGRQAVADVIIEVGDLYLPQPGRYEFRLIINRDVKAELPIEVVYANPQLGQ